MAVSHQDVKTYPIDARTLYSLATSAARAAGTHIEYTNTSTGVIRTEHTIYWNGFAGGRIWQKMFIEVQPVDAHESVIGVTSSFPGCFSFTDIFNRNEKMVNDFFAILDGIIDREVTMGI